MRLSSQERAHFLRVAATAAGFTSLGRWADAHNLSQSAVYRTAQGRHVGDRVDGIVDRFIIATLVPFCDRLQRAIQPHDHVPYGALERISPVREAS